MSDELDTRLGALATLTPPAPFDPADAVRARGRLRARRQRAAAVVAAVAALGLAGTTVGPPLLTDPRRDAFTGRGATPAPAATLPFDTFMVPPTDPRLPDRIFLTAADLPAGASPRVLSYQLGFSEQVDGSALQCRDPLPGQYPAREHLLATRAIAFHLTDFASGRHLSQSIRLYETGWAGRSFADLDAAVPRCSGESRRYDYRTVASGFAGQDSRLIAATAEHSGQVAHYVVVVRVGDRVTTIESHDSADEAAARHLGTAAAARLAAG